MEWTSQIQIKQPYALAEVFFEKDGRFWFDVGEDGDLELKPDRSAVFRVRKSDFKNEKKVLSHVEIDIRNKELKKYFNKNVKDAAPYDPVPFNNDGLISTAISSVLEWRKYKSDLAGDLKENVNFEYVD